MSAITIQLPSTGFLRVSQIVSHPPKNGKPAVPGILPVGYSTWWANVASGKFPPGIKLTSKITVWRVEDIRALIERSAAEGRL